ncbi:hypothetical protein [Bradyrhizobium acaciae]|uniref:hypothetical protein n=1 Tax=Bradyrhizobium acaciae TaxID=2683706 RepID=UPI001E54D453|nr:hypothetical protein [Bradyrhizobium acaciae]MCC8982156.1 hypothetical protein [Bradyrhizobium acaciae]
MRTGTTAVVLFLAFSAFAPPAYPAERKIVATSPLQVMTPGHLDKANGIGPRFQFAQPPSELPAKCATSIRPHLNDGGFVDYPGLRTAEEFRSKAARGVPLNADDAAGAAVHTNYTLSGEGSVSPALCFNAKAGAEARGFCTAVISGNDYTVVYNFDPVACQYDNLGVARALETRLSVGSLPVREQEPDCAAKLEEFVTDIDEVLSKKPRDIFDVMDVLDRHFPLHGCTAERVPSVLDKSRYFRSVGMNGPKMHVFTLASREVVVGFGLTDSGDSELPYAKWTAPSL